MQLTRSKPSPPETPPAQSLQWHRQRVSVVAVPLRLAFCCSTAPVRIVFGGKTFCFFIDRVFPKNEGDHWQHCQRLRRTPQMLDVSSCEHEADRIAPFSSSLVLASWTWTWNVAYFCVEAFVLFYMNRQIKERYDDIHQQWLCRGGRWCSPSAS